jgi:CheY-like chemotaxis protein
LLHNAAKFTPDGGSVRVELSAESHGAILRVIDSGAGVLPDQLERVFDMFTRIHRPGVVAEPGLGIGLALARRLAEMHGGSLTVTSDGEGRGATFTLLLPTSGTVHRPSAAPGASPSLPDAPRLDIVVVEDNEDIADALFDWLEELGHRVTVARTGRAGVESVRANQPDLVLCDLGLPDLDGLAVCRQIREFPADRQPVMVALTGWGREDDLRRTAEAGFDHHLTKPVAPEKLNALLHAVGKASMEA